MIFLEKIIVNILIVVFVMYVDRYVLNDYFRGRLIWDRAFKLWLTATFFSVLWYLVKSVDEAKVLAMVPY